MGLAHSPSIVTNGLVFAYDMANTLKSWKGAPTVNHFSIPTPDSSNNVTFSINGTGIFQRVYSGTYGGYTIKPTDVVYKYVLGLAPTGCHYHGNTISVTAGQSPTWSFDYYIDPSTTGYPVTNYLANIESSVGVGAAIGDPTPSIIGVWKRATQTSAPASTNGTFNAYLYPGACGSQLATGGFILYKNPQVEFNSFATPFVAGTRLANNNLESTPNYPTWNASGNGSSASGGTLTFVNGSYNSKGVWDLYKTYSGLSTATNYTWSALVKLGTATNLLVTMNNASAWNTGPSTIAKDQLSTTSWTRVSITGTTNTGSFNIHLGASANSELAATIQSGGTVFLQDVRLELTGSQTTLVDLTGNSTVTPGTLTYASDNTFNFDYTGPGYVSVPLATAFNKTEGTINLWLYPTRYNGGNGYFVNREDATANAVDWFWIGPYGDTLYFRIGNGGDCCSNDLSFGNVSTVIPLNTWVNMCFTWKANGTSVIYKNGVLLTSRAIGNIPNTNPAANGRFGLGHAYADSYYNGKMPVAQIYNRQFTNAEVISNFNALRGRYGI